MENRIGIDYLINVIKDDESAILYILTLNNQDEASCKMDECIGKIKIKKSSRNLGGIKLVCNLCNNSFTSHSYLNCFFPKIPVKKIILSAYFYAHRVSNW